MKITSFSCIPKEQIMAKCESYTSPYSYVRELNLYDRIIFKYNYNTKYVCFNNNSLTPCDDIDVNAPLILERTINPEIDPRTYIVIKLGDKQRDPLIIHR